jgi:hypothetical protein
MKYLFFILLPLIFSCKKKETINPTTIKDTVVVFQIWGDQVNTVNLTFTQGVKQWTKTINYNTVHTSDSPLEVVLPVSGIKPVGAYQFKIQSTSIITCDGSNATFTDLGNRVKVNESCGGIID